MAWLKILVFSIFVFASGVVGFDYLLKWTINGYEWLEANKQYFLMPLAIFLGIAGLGVLGWFVGINGSLNSLYRRVSVIGKRFKHRWQRFNDFFDNWYLYAGKPYLRVKDENSDEFFELSHKQKIKFLQNKYAIKYLRYSSDYRVAQIIFFGIISTALLGFIFMEYHEKERVVGPLALLIVTAPVALAVWYFRDQNNLRELDRQHHDVTLKDFQQLQEWATGNIADGYNEDGSLKKHAETLQISALHSLRAYLKGEFGESFKRGAFEIYTSVLKTEHQNILKLFQEQKVPLSNEEIQKVINGIPLAKQINQIASEEWFCLLVNHDFPTAGISLLGVNLSGKGIYLRHLKKKCVDFKDANLIGASFVDAQMQRAILWNAQMQSCQLTRAKLQCADLHSTNLVGADLRSARLDGVIAIEANFQGASLARSHMYGANLGSARLAGADLHNAFLQAAYMGLAQIHGAVFSNNTKLAGVTSDLNYPHAVTPEGRVLIQNGIDKKGDIRNLSGSFLDQLYTEQLKEIEYELKLYLPSGEFETVMRRIRDFNPQKPLHYYIDKADVTVYNVTEAQEWIKEIESNC